MDLFRLNWDQSVKLCETLAMSIGSHKPDILVGISRGGLVPVRILSDVLNVKDVLVIGIRSYKKIGEIEEKPKIIQEINIDLKGKRILMVDDIADSGKTLIAAKKYLLSKGASEVKSATIHYKPISLFKPDYFVVTTNSWIAYPWEARETGLEMKEK